MPPEIGGIGSSQEAVRMCRMAVAEAEYHYSTKVLDVRNGGIDKATFSTVADYDEKNLSIVSIQSST